MSVIRRAALRLDPSSPNLERLTLTSATVGAGYLETGEVSITQGKSVSPGLQPALHPSHAA